VQRIPEGEAIGRKEDARYFNEVMGRGRVQRQYKELAEAVAQMGVPEGGRILDVGTGTGFTALAIARLLRSRVQIVGLDLSVAMLTLAAENARRENLQDTLTWQEGDAKSMPFSDGEFELVVSSGSLHHWDDPVKIFDEIARVLRPSGRCIVQDLKRNHHGFGYILSRAIGLTIPKDFRVHYYGSIHASYKPAEVREMLDRSRLRDARVEEDLMGLRIVK